MDAWPLIVLLIIGAPILLAIWLIAKAVRASSRIDELTHRLQILEIEVSRLRDERATAHPPEPKTAVPHIHAESSEAVVEPPPEPVVPQQPAPTPAHIATPPPIP